MSGIILVLYLYGSTPQGTPIVMQEPSREQCVKDGQLYTKEREGAHNYILRTQFNFPHANGNFSCVDTITKSRYDHVDLNNDSGWQDMK